MDINWKRKLASRKFWAAVAAWLTATLSAFGADASTVTQITAITSGIGALIVYILSEAYVDSKKSDD